MKVSLNAAIKTLADESSRSRDYRFIESQGIEFSRAYDGASHGSELRDAYNKLQVIAFTQGALPCDDEYCRETLTLDVS